MPTIERSEARVTDERLLKLENALGITLPQQYRNFMLSNNGGKPRPGCFTFQTRQDHYSDSVVDWFLAVYDGEYDNFETYFRTYKVEKNRLRNELVPIAHDPGGNLVCISTSGNDLGKVYFWDHEQEASDDELPNYDNVSLIANSFGEFLENLKASP